MPQLDRWTDAKGVYTDHRRRQDLTDGLEGYRAILAADEFLHEAARQRCRDEIAWYEAELEKLEQLSSYVCEEDDPAQQKYLGEEG